jgi:hypothetical protein
MNRSLERWYSLRRHARGWLGEAQNLWFLSDASVPVTTLFEELRAGQRLLLNKECSAVRDLQSALIGGEGLPFQVGADYEAPVADLLGEETPSARSIIVKPLLWFPG